MKPHELLADLSKWRCCAIALSNPGGSVPGVGTGTAIKHNGDLFIITCAHVAKPEEDGVEMLWINFHRTPQFDAKETTVVLLDRELDLAMLQVSKRVAPLLRSVQPLVIDDVGSPEEFRSAQPGPPYDYGFAGFPHALMMLHEPDKIVAWAPMVYTTVVKMNDGTRLLLDYSAGVQVTEMPHPSGISGSTVFQVRGAGKGELWVPGKAVAVQHSWDSRQKHLVCSPIEPIRAYLAGL